MIPKAGRTLIAHDLLTILADQQKGGAFLQHNFVQPMKKNHIKALTMAALLLLSVAGSVAEARFWGKDFYLVPVGNGVCELHRTYDVFWVTVKDELLGWVDC